MYFTIDEWETSSAPADARRSFNTLRAHAQTLATLSSSFSGEAREVTAAYRSALNDGTAQAWRRFVTASAALAEHGEAVDALLALDDSDRTAWHFFQQIARENADLIDSRSLVVA
jgi:prophage DNA circulation protein